METQKIVKALELAIKNSTYIVNEQVTLLKKEPVEHINGETLKASIQSIIDLCKEETVNYIEPNKMVEQLSK